MSALADRARRAWETWGAYAKWTFCADCGENHPCRAKRQRGPWLCLDCFDQR